jgi:prepilin-type N-terminal cleavage/methylation domain-containing protein
VNKAARNGFTLLEIMVVLMILTILIVMGYPRYFRALENSKADAATTMVEMIGVSNRIYNLNTGQWVNSSGAPISSTSPLVTGNYVADMDWANLPYQYYACNPGTTCSGCFGTPTNLSACAMRVNTAASPYNTWGYQITWNGSMNNAGTPAPAPSQ